MKTLLLAAIILAACGPGDPVSVLVPGERGRVVRVLDGDALVLDTGQSVRLVGIEAPVRARRDRLAQPYAEEAARMLEDMALGRVVRLHYAGLTRDRYDRALAHAITEDALGERLWLNLEMARRGGARVRTWPDTALAAEALVSAEAEARAAGRGLWALADYTIVDARDWQSGSPPGFVIIAGILGPAQRDEGPRAACTRPLLASDVALDIEPAAAALCQLEPGARVQVRGWLRAGRMSLTHPENLEALAREPQAVAGHEASSAN